MNKRTFVMINLVMIIFIVIAIVIAGSNGYNRGIEDLESYKNLNYIYHEEWKEVSNGSFSEYLVYNNLNFGSYKKGDLYSIEFSNNDKNISFGISYNPIKKESSLKILDLVCLKESDEEDIYNHKCFKIYELNDSK